MLIRSEFRGEMLGVQGRFENAHAWPNNPHLFSTQSWVSDYRPIEGYGRNGRISVAARFDDNCKNGRHSFAITATVYTAEIRGDCTACGCLHEDIAAVFPELVPLIQWHLVSTDGPMHYLANTVFHAGNRDHYGREAGQASRFENGIRFGNNPILHTLKPGFLTWLKDAGPQCFGRPYDFEVIRVDHRERGKPGAYQYPPKFTFGGYDAEWHACPFGTEREALEFLAALQQCQPRFEREPVEWSEGKARDLDAARRAAVWPDATDAELMQEPDALRATLEARLPALLERFRADIVAAGFLWETGQATQETA